MRNLAILSRDFDNYLSHMEKFPLPDLQLIHAGSLPEGFAHWEDVQILLAEPDLAAQVLPHCRQLQWLQSTWAGVTPILQQPKRNYLLSGIKQVFGKQMREYVFTYLLHFARKVNQFDRLQQGSLWQQPEVEHLFGKKIGILGVGSIGAEVAKMAKAFDMHVVGVSNRSRACAHVDEYVTTDELPNRASDLDFLVSLLPHTPQTEHLINADLLSALPANCVLINAGRGQVVDDEALHNALQHGEIRAAVLDVFDVEPLPEEHPFWRTKNLVITQHTAAISHPDEIAQIFIRNCRLFATGQSLQGLVDFEQGY